jgi:putative holliday junction resolvase
MHDAKNNRHQDTRQFTPVRCKNTLQQGECAAIVTPEICSFMALSPLSLPDTASHIPLRLPPGRLLGLDLGSVTIGLALSDAGQCIATPLKTLHRKKFRDDAAALLALVDAEQVAGLVVGLPLNMNGSAGPRVQSVRQFVRNLQALRPALPVVLQDERLTTLAAERAMLEADLSRAKRAARVDAVAAGLILQAYLDRSAALAPAPTAC